MNWRNVGLVAKREFLEQMRTKAFWLGAISLPLVMVGFGAIGGLVASIDSVDRYAVLDKSGWVHDATRRHIVAKDIDAALDAIADERRRVGDNDALMAEVRAAIASEDGRRAFHSRAAELVFALATESGRIPTPIQPLERFADWWVANPDAVAGTFPDVSLARYREVSPARLDTSHLNALVKEERILGYFVIPEDPVRSGEGAHYVADNLADQGLQHWYGQQVTEVVKAQRMREANIDPATAEWLSETIPVAAAKPTDAGSELVTDEELLEQWVPAGFVLLLWLSIFTINQMLLTSTIEEKSGKLAELLLASMSPADLMAGKVLGIGGAGLAIVSVWVAMALIALGAGVSLGGDLTIGTVLKPALLAGFLVYFLLGYLFYAAMYCAVGSLCNTIQEAQSLALPLMLLPMMSFLLVVPVTNDPNGLVATVTSWIPPLTPGVMLNRMADPPGIATIVGTTALMVASVWYALRLSGRIFENGILRTGKPPSLRQLPSLLRG